VAVFTAKDATLSEIRLNIGAGETSIPGFLPIDAALGHDALCLPFPDGSVDEVYSSHCLEHIHHSKTLDALQEWVRVLKPGGTIRIAVPHIEKVLAKHREDPESYDWKFLSAWLYGTYDHPLDRHQAQFTPESISTMLRGLGIENIGEFEGEYEDQAKYNEFTLNIGGTKREIVVPKKPSVALVMSEPRFGPLDTYKCIVNVCKDTGWPYMPMGGTEWGKGMELAMQRVGAEYAPDYVITLDYDSAFRTQDLLDLVEFMQKRPDVMAAWPAEMHRHMDLPLGMNPDGAAQGVYGKEDEDGFVRMWSGHFGCTIIRRQAFESLPHPWFWSLPDPVTGDWKNGSDADITFWRSMHNFGMKFGQLNSVVIGHGEWCYKWPTTDAAGNAKTFWQPIQHYRKNGKPTQARFDFAAWVAHTKETLKDKYPQQAPAVPVVEVQSHTLPKVYQAPLPEPVHVNGES
jgi:predicted SAM-dependent methyltransferase